MHRYLAGSGVRAPERRPAPRGGHLDRRGETGGPDDSGYTLVVVLVLMLVLSVGALTASAIVTNTTVGAVSSRSTTQSQAASDSGIAAAVAQARRTGAFCGISVTQNTAPKYSVTSTCAGDRVTFTSQGTGADGVTTTTAAVFTYSTASAGDGGDMVFYGDTTFTKEVVTNTLTEDLLSVVIPTGSFTCQAHIPANIVLSGDFAANGGCTIDGSVVSGGKITMCCGADTIKGNVTASSSSTHVIRGTINGDLHTGGKTEFGWESKSVGGNVKVSGGVDMGNHKLLKALTLPTSATLNMQSGSIAGGTNRMTTVEKPAAPQFEPWFDFTYKPSEWQPYENQTFTRVTLVNSGSGPGTCGYYNAWPASGWTELANLTSPTIIDARACSSLSANSGTQPVVTLKTNILFLAKSYDLTRLTMKGTSTTHVRAWFTVEDTTANASPTCGGGAGNIGINGTVMSENITAMAYTPCTVDVQGQGFDSWRGTFYGGKFNYGGGLKFYGDGIVLPGMPAGTVKGTGSTTAQLGALVSQRDVR